MERLIDELRKLPGVGTKSAQRFAFHILRASDQDAESLSSAIRNLRQHLRLCSICNNVTDIDPCSYCSNATRNPHLLCVVEEPTNITSIEKTRSFNGLYHVLHGTLSPIHGVGPEHLRLQNLWSRLADAVEVILATSPTVEGEATARYIADELHRRSNSLRISRIATGVPAGSDIEYADEVTMTRSLENRREM
ncbi:MAG: recombination protein RecR [Acidobacteria bacterium]|nr:recombination protein RecR [Acidobacteriota bacterium]